MPDLNKAIEWLVSIADNDTHGYSQSNRQGPDYDCSSLTLNALSHGGFAVNVSGYTGNMYDILQSVGFRTVSDNKCLKGDIYLTPFKHVVMSYADGYVVTAAGNKDGRTGDSSGREIYKLPFYTPAYGWVYHMRYVTDKTDDTAPNFKVGKTYTLLYNLNVRKTPGINGKLVGYDGLTADGKKHDSDKNGSLDAGTKVTCKALKTIGTDIWMQIPSGWIAVYYQDCMFVE